MSQDPPPGVMPMQASTIRILFAGDLMTGRGIDQVLAKPLPPATFETQVRNARRYVRLAERANGPIPRRNPPAYVWGDAIDEMERLAPDLRIVNLGTAITSAVTAWSGKDTYHRMSPRHIGSLTAGGLSACAMANDHALDFDYPGLRETLSALHEADIAIAGAGADASKAHEPAVFPLQNGTRLLLFAWATPSSGIPAGWAATESRPGIAVLPGLGEADAREVKACVEHHRRPGDLVIVSLHWGDRRMRLVPPEHREFAHRLVDLGAVDVLHGHASHAPLPIEVYEGKLILHGCGDLINDDEGLPSHEDWHVDLGCLYAVTLARADGRLQELEIVPFQRRRFRLCWPEERATQWLLERLNQGGADFCTPIAIERDGRLRLTWRA